MYKLSIKMYGHVDANIMQITKLYSSLRFVCVDRTCVSVCVLVVVGGGGNPQTHVEEVCVCA